MKASKHEQYGLFTLLAIFFPLIGVIIGVIYLTRPKKIDQKVGEHTLSVGILSMILWSLALLFI